MKWSWKIGEFAGIGVYIHATFLLLIAWVAYIHWSQEESIAAVVVGILFILALFFCVLLHEFGHALMARRYGVPTRDITLLPIGGVARLQRIPEEPREEFWIAIAGPAVNVVIAAILWLWIVATGTPIEPQAWTSIADGPIVPRLFAVNVVLVVFNMIPAFPMDGGRVLRALLAMRMDYARATSVAAGLGQMIALGFGFLGLFTNPFLIFIALFVWMGAGQEASLAGMKAALGGIPVRRAMITEYRVLRPDDPLQRAIDEILAGSQHDFPIVDDSGKVVGILTRSRLITALAGPGLQALVSDVMDPVFQTVQEGDMLDHAFLRLQDCQCRTMPVMRQGRLAGLFTMDNVGEFLSIQSALSQRRRGIRGSLIED